ncbi:cAMP-dependent protein kinase catalytic subunit [Drosophila subobscura]|uniref:cAMP-dependent protein kinase catalytic subunit n=1 Tax=Drosophila subobscura TaxID=7241 RepID=UPI00155A7F1E|nr:cAMP-dependent protein kinase catalytic subunit [Drosophila subobscura]
MHLYTRVILLAVTLFSVNAAHFGGDAALEQVLFRMVEGQMESRALSPAGQACSNNYVNATTKNSEKLANTTNACEDVANSTTVANDRNSNATVLTIRNQLLSLEQNLQLCRNETDSARFINCTVSTFDKNLQLLDSSNSLAYQTQSQFASNATVVQATRSNCISAAVGDAKVQAIQAANDYDSCLAKIPAQRVISEKPKEQEKKEQKPVQQQQQKPVQQLTQQQQQQQLTSVVENFPVNN